MDLYTRSQEIILNNQSASGAYIACPTFPTYHYSWFRDGTFTAYAIGLSGHADSAGLFYDWAAASLLQHGTIVREELDRLAAGGTFSPRGWLHTRYTLEGEEADNSQEEWPNFQLDGFGTWLWGLHKHLVLTGEPLKPEWRLAAKLVSDYLVSLWHMPCYDCWEEFPDKVHPHTLAAIYAGLRAYQEMTGCDRSDPLRSIKELLFSQAAPEGYFVKSVGRVDVDASLLGLAVPYELVELTDARMTATVQRIERDLYRGGGVHRYALDTYYGGGEWVLLAAWLGWYHARVGNIDRARQLLSWIEAQADTDGNLPEQVPATLNDPSYYQPWVERWGHSASPLLWSHANYIILRKMLEE